MAARDGVGMAKALMADVMDMRPGGERRRCASRPDVHFGEAPDYAGGGGKLRTKVSFYRRLD